MLAIVSGVKFVSEVSTFITESLTVNVLLEYPKHAGFPEPLEKTPNVLETLIN